MITTKVTTSMYPIKFLDLRPTGFLRSMLADDYYEVLNSGTYIGGREVEVFEQEWAEEVGVKYCVGVGNGHDALALACRFYHESYDPVLPVAFTPWKTCLPTWSAVRNGKLSPFLLNGTAEGILIAVHIYGEISIPAHKSGTVIIEDCAQAHGAQYNGRKAGTFGDVAAWSFYPTKNLGAMGDAGAVTTNDEALAQYVRRMKNYGDSSCNGINSRLDPLQAAILRTKLRFLDHWNEQRRENAWVYLNEIHCLHKVKLPVPYPASKPCWHIFAIEAEDRDGLRKFLAGHGVETMIHYPDVPYPSIWKVPEAEEWTKRTLSLPVAPHVTSEECKKVAKLINEYYGA